MLVTGATGFLGRHLMIASERNGWELVAPSSAIMNVLGRERTISEIREWRPNVVVHLAYKRNDRRTIVEGTSNVAEGAQAARAHLVHVSTDMVFRGRPITYSESDHPSPIDNYGRWKVESEQIAASIVPSALIIRPSMLYGTDRLAKCQTDVEAVCEGRSTMAFFKDEIRCAAFAGDVASAISTLASHTHLSGPIHVGGPPISRADLACHVADWLGYDGYSIPLTTLAESGQTRPGVLMLDTRLAESHDAGCRPIQEVLRLRH